MGSKTVAAFQTSGSSALAPMRTSFTVIDGTRRRPVRDHEPQIEHLTATQGIKAILAMAAVIVALAATFVLSDAHRNASFVRSFSDIQSTVVTVHEGDSLWDIAEDHAPQGVDTQSVIRWIRLQNDLDSATIYAGQTLVVPNV